MREAQQLRVQCDTLLWDSDFYKVIPQKKGEGSGLIIKEK